MDLDVNAAILANQRVYLHVAVYTPTGTGIGPLSSNEVRVHAEIMYTDRWLIAKRLQCMFGSVTHHLYLTSSSNTPKNRHLR